MCAHEGCYARRFCNLRSLVCLRSRLWHPVSTSVLGHKVRDTGERCGDLRFSFSDGIDRPLSEQLAIPLEHNSVRRQAAQVGNYVTREECHCLLSTGLDQRPEASRVNPYYNSN